MNKKIIIISSIVGLAIAGSVAAGPITKADSQDVSVVRVSTSTPISKRQILIQETKIAQPQVIYRRKTRAELVADDQLNRKMVTLWTNKVASSSALIQWFDQNVQ